MRKKKKRELKEDAQGEWYSVSAARRLFGRNDEGRQEDEDDREAERDDRGGEEAEAATGDHSQQEQEAQQSEEVLATVPSLFQQTLQSISEIDINTHRLFLADLLEVLHQLRNIVLSGGLLSLGSLRQIGSIQVLSQTQLVDDAGHQLRQSYPSPPKLIPTLLLGLTEDSSGVEAGANPGYRSLHLHSPYSNTW